MTHTGERLVDWLISGTKRLHQALTRYWNRQAPTPQPGQPEPYTDQW